MILLCDCVSVTVLFCKIMGDQDDYRESTDTSDEENSEIEKNVFSQPWKDSDLVLVVEDKEFHVHRALLAMHSEAFKAMFNEKFKDAEKDRIELKDDNYQAMLLFIKLLYPANLFDDDDGKVDISDENIFDILVLADKYVAVSIIKQCMKEAERLKPENAMHLLPYAVRHKLPLQKILDVISRRVSTSKLTDFGTEQFSASKDSVYDQCLVEKCRFLESVAKQANTMILLLLDEVVEKNISAESKDYNSSISTDGFLYVQHNNQSTYRSTQCVLKHEHLKVSDYEKARKCEHCLKTYQKNLIEKYVLLKSMKLVSNPYQAIYQAAALSGAIKFQDSTFTSSDVLNLLELLGNL